MEACYFLIHNVLRVAAFLWASRSGQFDDLEGPAHRILMDEDGRANRPVAPRPL